MLILHPPWCDNIPISSLSLLHANLAWGGHPGLGRAAWPGAGSLPGADRPAWGGPAALVLPESGASEHQTHRLLRKRPSGFCTVSAHSRSGRLPSPCRPASSAPPPVNLLLPSSVTTFHSPLMSWLLILARFSKLPHAHSIHTRSSRTPRPPPPHTPRSSPPSLWMEVLITPSPSQEEQAPQTVSLMRKVSWSVPMEPACGRPASILNRQPAGHGVAELYKAGEGASARGTPPVHPLPPHCEHPEARMSLIHPAAQVRAWHRAGVSDC